MTLKDARKFLGCSRQTLHRYIASGRLPYKLEGKKKVFNKDDLLKIATDLATNKEKFRPDAVGKEPKPQETMMTKKEEIQHLMQVATPEDEEELLTQFGKDVMIEVSEYLSEKGLASSTNRLAIFRYALAVQTQMLYMKSALENHLPEFHNMANIYTKQIQHYEKELGLTPAAISKIKPMDAETKDIDPMEALLND